MEPLFNASRNLAGSALATPRCQASVSQTQCAMANHVRQEDRNERCIEFRAGRREGLSHTRVNPQVTGGRACGRQQARRE